MATRRECLRWVGGSLGLFLLSAPQRVNAAVEEVKPLRSKPRP